MKKKNIYLLGLALLFAAPQTMAQDVAAHFDMRYKLGNKRQITSPELFLPLQQDTNSLLFADIRAMFDGDNNKEGNLGLGYRQLEDDYIWGVYGFFDRRKSQFDAYHSQATIGAEWLTEDWDFRVNGYLPLTDKKNLDGFGGGPTSIVVQGNNVLQLGGGGAFEKGMGGFDAEVGYQILPGFRAFAGGYTFRADDVPDVNGYRGRLQYDVNDYVRLGLEYQRDDVRGENRYAEIRVRIPFGANAKNDVKGLRKRLAEPVVRDIDIVTSVKETGGPAGGSPITNPDTGQAQEIWYVDNSAAPGGDGSFENPYITLQDAIASVGAGDIIYVYRGDATSNGLDGNFLLGRAGMQLIGSNADLVYDGTRVTYGTGTGEVLIASGGRFPFLTNTSGGTVLTVANQNISIAGLDVSGASTDFAIKAQGGNISGLALNNVKIGGSQSGISLTTASTSSVTMNDVKISNISSTGILANNIGNLTMTDVDVTVGSLGVTDGIVLNYNTAGTYTASFDDVTLADHGRGLSFIAENGADVTANIINSASYSATRGVYASADSGALLAVTAADSVFDYNDYGTYIESLDNSTTLTFDYTDVVLSNSALAGFFGADQFTFNLSTNNAPMNLTSSTDGIYVRNTTGLSTVNLGTGVLVTGNGRGYVNEYASALGLAGGLYPGGVFGNTLNEADGAGNNVTGNTVDIDISQF